MVTTAKHLNHEKNILLLQLLITQHSISRLFDADMAMEQLNATKGQIGTQIGTAMLGTLNAAPQNILSLFR